MTTSAAWWPFVAINTTTRPLRSLPESRKDEKYHVDCARFYLGNATISDAVNAFREDYAWNKFFYQDGWGMDEDENTFLKDSYGNRLSKRRIGQNIVSPMVNRLKGQARNIGISATVTCIGQQAKDRKEAAMTEKMLLSWAAQENEAMAAMMMDLYGVSEDQQETLSFFENSYSDALERGGKQLITMLSYLNRFDQMKEEDAERAALCGLFAHCPDLSGDHITWERVEPEDIIWDATARRPDFSDASFVGKCPFMDPSTIAERYGISQQLLKELEKAVWTYPGTSSNDNNMYPQGKPRVFTVYWRDVKYAERAYVMKDGEPHLCILNEEKDGVIYTEADIIDPPDTETNKRYFGTMKKARKAYEVVRTCTFIPSEYLPVAMREKRKGLGYPADVVLDWGVYPYQEGDPYYEGGVKLPIKLTAWSFVGGRIMAPVTYARNPQRFVNQMASSINWYLSKAGGKGPIIDPNSLDPMVMDESEVQKNMKEGDMVLVDSHGLGVPNVVGQYDTSPDQSMLGMFQMLQQGVIMGQSSTGISDTAMGQPLKSDQLVGTTNALLQQTTLVNMPFYSAEVDQYGQIHQFDIEVGKVFYAERPHTLRELVGDRSAAAMMLEPSARVEKYRLGVKMQLDDDMLKKEAQQIALTYAAPPFGWLDQTTFGELMTNGAYPEDVYKAILNVGRQRQEAQAQQAKAQQQQQMAAAAAQQQAQIDAEKAQYDQDVMKASSEMAKNDTKLKLPIVSNQSRVQADMMAPPEMA